MKINRIGQLGDIYRDSETGLFYKCVSVYNDSMGHVDCEWEETDGYEDDTPVEIPQNTVVEAPEEEPNEQFERRQSNHTNYNNYNKHKR